MTVTFMFILFLWCRQVRTSQEKKHHQNCQQSPESLRQQHEKPYCSPEAGEKEQPEIPEGNCR